MPPALSALSAWALPAAAAAATSPLSAAAPVQAWVTGGPVTNVSGPYALQRPLVAYAVTSAFGGQSGGLLALQECALAPAVSGGPAVVALTLESEGCGAGGAPPFGSGAVLRAPGWIAPSSSAAAALGWAAVRQPETNATVGATPGALWRCRAALSGPEGSSGDRGDSGGGSVLTATLYSAAFDDPSCAAAGPGYVPDRLLGYALGPLTTAPTGQAGLYQ